MCGISGILTYGNNTPSVDLVPHLEKMNSALKHRGPDDHGIWVHNKLPLGLAQTRLSIIDLSQAGHQPMEDERKNTLTFNGEIFNYRDIRTKYFPKEQFRSETDTETLLKLFSRFGTNMFDHIDGMFAFGLWDEKNQELLLARDPSGKKPLYYTEIGGTFVFASELKAILSLPWINKELDERTLYDFLTYGLVVTPDTMFKNIYKFAPGHFMIVNRKGIKSYEPYYSLTKTDLAKDDESSLKKLIFSTLERSVRYRMISDVPVGAFLSGGVDSSAIVALMRKFSPDNNIKTFTIGFEGQPEYNELTHAEQVAKLFQTSHFEKIVKPSDLLEMIHKITDIYDEPQADTTAIPIYFISQLAKEQNIKVVLNGDGPDELFAGYRNYLKYIEAFKYFKLAGRLPKAVQKAIFKGIGLVNEKLPAYEMFGRLINNQEFFWPGAGNIKESFKHRFLKESFTKSLRGYSSYQPITNLKHEFNAFANASVESDFIGWMCFTGYKIADIERFLYRSDRLAMAHSVESRSPFLSKDVVNMALSIPGRMKIKNGEPKYIFKKALESILPDSVLYRKKMGFNLPIREWAGNTISNYVIDHAKPFTSNYGFFHAEKLIDSAKALQSGSRKDTNTVWTMYFLMNWFNKWM